jgi:hypothetical protein
MVVFHIMGIITRIRFQCQSFLKVLEVTLVGVWERNRDNRGRSGQFWWEKDADKPLKTYIEQTVVDPDQVPHLVLHTLKDQGLADEWNDIVRQRCTIL